MEAAEILVIILATAFALFLVLAIVLVVLLIKIATQIRHITSSAQRTVGNIENIVGVFQKAAAPTVVTKVVSEVIQKIADFKKRKN
jgi:hypothetical protein